MGIIVPGEGTTLAELRDMVRVRLDDYPLPYKRIESGDGTWEQVTLPHYPVVASTIDVTIDGSPETVTVDLDSGVVTFSSPPGDDTEVVLSYTAYQWSDEEINDAINNAIYLLWSEFPTTDLDTTTITASATTYEYALPADCVRLLKVEKSMDPTNQMYEVDHGWRVVEHGLTKYVKLYSPSNGYTYRLFYVTDPALLSTDLDTMEEDSGFPERAKWAVVFQACWLLLEYSLLPRVRTNQFKNAEGVNVPKIYEVQRIAADFRALADIEVRRLRLGPKRYA